MKPATRSWVGYANVLGCWTMFPLLVRDGLRIPYYVLTGLWCWLMGLPPVSVGAYVAPFSGEEDGGLSVVSKLLHLGTYAGMVAWHVVEAFVEPPEKKPDLWVVANVCVGAAGFGMCYLWCLWRVVEGSEMLYDIGVLKRRSGVQKKTQ